MVKKSEAPKRQGQNVAMAEEWQGRIRILMEEQGISMRRLSKDAELGTTTVRHALVVADDIGVKTLAKLADALGTSLVYLAAGVHAAIGHGGSSNKRVRILPIHNDEDVLRRRDISAALRGFVAVPDEDYPDDVQALVVRTRAMEPEGINQTPPQHTVILVGDVVIWARSARPAPGDVAVARGENALRLGRVAESEAGDDLILVSHNHLYPRVRLKANDLLGRVLAVHRQQPSSG